MEALNAEPAPLWVDALVEYPWREKVLTFEPRLPRAHYEPIEDEL